MHIRLQRNAKRPLYLQIKDQLEEEIEAGTLLPGTKLPSTRTLADELNVSRITVTSAYSELEVEGLAEGHVGSGTFVCGPEGSDRTIPSENPFEWRTTLLRPSGVSASGMLADMLHLAQQPDLISFALGAPASDLLPVRPFRRSINRVLRRQGSVALQYDDAVGYPPLRRTIAQRLSRTGVPTRLSEVLITSGSQQGLDLATRVLARPGTPVITESPTYLGALDVFQSHGLEVVGVPVDDEGMRLDRLEETLENHHPDLVYTITGFHNHNGTTMTKPRRRGLLELARQHDETILEDGVCSELRYGGSPPPPLRALNPGHRVVYINSFSKALLPGIRLGYLLASNPVRERLVAAKRATDLFTSSLLQRALHDFLAQGHLDPHVDTVRAAYAERRDAMFSALARHLPDGTRWTLPSGGLWVWVTMPASIDTAQLYLTALDHGVAFAVGAVFFPQHPTSSSLRLNFAAHPVERIEEGLRRLGEAVREELDRSRRPLRAAAPTDSRKVTSDQEGEV